MPKRYPGTGVKRLGEHSECSNIRERIEAFEAERPEDAVWAFDIKANLLFDWVYRLGAHEAALDAVKDLLGPNIFNTNTVFRIKEPGSGTNYGGHQDAARIELEPCFVIAYLAITASTPENGGLRVVPGSHRSALPFEIIVNKDGQAQRKVARTLQVKKSDALDLSLEPGEVTFFSNLLVHGSRANRSRQRRTPYRPTIPPRTPGNRRVRDRGSWCAGSTPGALSPANRFRWGRARRPVSSCAARSLAPIRKIPSWGA